MEKKWSKNYILNGKNSSFGVVNKTLELSKHQILWLPKTYYPISPKINTLLTFLNIMRGIPLWQRVRELKS